MQKAASQEHASNLLALIPVLGPLAKSRADDESVSQAAGRLALNGIGAGVGKKVTQSIVHPLAAALPTKIFSRFGLGRVGSLIGRSSSSFWGNVAGIPLGAVAGDMMADRAMDSIAERAALTKASMVKAGMDMLPPAISLTPIGLPTIGDPKLIEETIKARPEAAKEVVTAPVKAVAEGASKAADKMIDKLNGGASVKALFGRAMHNLGRMGAGTGVGALIGAGIGGATDKLTGGSNESALDAAMRASEGGAIGGAMGSLVRPNGVLEAFSKLNKIPGGRLWRSSLASSAMLGAAASGLYTMAHDIGGQHIPDRPVA